MRFPLLFVFCLCFLLGCSQNLRPGLLALEKAYSSQPTSAPQLAMAGHYALLAADNTQEAEGYFEKALLQEENLPWALYGLMLVAHGHVDFQKQADAALRLLQTQAQHPLAEVAAQHLLRIKGISPSLDLKIFERLLPLRLEGEAAILQADILADMAYRQADFQNAARFLAESGKPNAWSLVGPLFPSRLLSFAEPLEIEATGDLRTLPNNALGPVPLRILHSPMGLRQIPYEGNAGEVYVLATEVEVLQPGPYAIRILWDENYVLFVNQQQLLSSLHFPVLGPRLQTVVLHLEAGWHRLMLRTPSTRPNSNVDFRVSPLAGDNTPLRFRPAQGQAPRPLAKLQATVHTPAELLFEKLQEEVGEGLAAFVVAQSYAVQDANQAKRFLHFWPENMATSHLHLLRAEIEAADAQTMEASARAKVSWELENAQRKNPQLLRAALLGLRLNLNESRQAAAEQLLQKTQQRFGRLPAEFEFENARLYLELGLHAETQKIVERLSNAGKGLCSASFLLHQLAIKQRANPQSQTSLEAFSLCPGAEEARVAFFKARGEWEKVLPILERLEKEDESRVAFLFEEHTRVLLAQRRFEEALKYLKTVEPQWPYKASLYHLMADIYEALGENPQALQARQKALKLMPADLNLQRLVERSLTGKELLEAFAISTEEALKTYANTERAEASDTAYILDASAMRFFEDGSMVERTHIIEKAFSQRGVMQAAEVEIPPGAILLKLRTLKADGSILEPESIEHKNSISMPSVEPGDMVEVEYLNAQPSRGLLRPGFSSPAFFFQVPFKPNSWSTLTVVAPKTFKVQVDAQGQPTRPLQLRGEELVFSHEEKNLPAFEVAPHSPPLQTEWLPFISVGANIGYEDFVHAAADNGLEAGRASFEVEQFARKAAAGQQGIAAVEAIYNAVHSQIVDGGSMQISAAATVGNDRGSRFWLLYAALKSLGMDVRVAAALSIFSNPKPMLFPPPNNLGYWCLRVKLKNHPPVWLDASTRFLPFGSLPEYVDKHSAYVLPEIGAPLERVSLPEAVPSLHNFKLNLQLDEKGNLSGEGEETHTGFMAARLSESFGKLPEEQRQFKIQDNLSEQFAGVSVENIEIVPVKAPGEAFVIRYQLKAQGFARTSDNNTWVLPSISPLQKLGQRYATVGFRTTTLFIPSPENLKIQLNLTLPENVEVTEPIESKQILSPWGSFVRQETAHKNTLVLEERFQLAQGRIPPENYEQFVGFAGEVDLFQAHEFVLSRLP
ncbi:MAG: hypothetical protein FWG75_05975 [Cystobacterineae bacterium]|nr:hypothetical protein [Cystobacterineae bacterium]